MNYIKIAIIGAGNVGSTIAYSCMMQSIAAEIILVDINDDLCEGQVIDLHDALAFSKASRITHGTFKAAGSSDIIIICAGAKQKPEEKRTELIQTNKKVIASIFDHIKPIKKDSLIIMVTNPLADHPRNLIFGSGTYLDTQRLKGYVSQKVGIAPESIHTYMLGEHGDSEFAVWSTAHIAGNPFSSFKELTQDMLIKMAQETRDKAYEIIQCKGSTYFGIGACVAIICKAIIFDKKKVLPLSFYHEEHQICFSLPVVLGVNGIEKLFDIPLNDQEQTLLAQSIEKIKNDIQVL